MDMIERLRAEGSQLSIDAAAEIARLTMARIPHKDDNALGLGLLNFFIDMMQRDHPPAHRREMLVSYISNTTAPLRDDNARLRAAATEAEKMFRWYGDIHAAKPDPDKAARNYEMADKMAAALEAR